MEEGLTDELIEAINKELEDMCVPAQYSLIGELENLKVNKKRDFVKKFINERTKLKESKSKSFKNLTKELDKKKYEKIFDLIDEILKIDKELKLDIYGTIENLYDILKELPKEENFNQLFDKRKAIRSKEIKNLETSAVKMISEGKFYDAAYTYREAARLARLFSSEDEYNKMLKLAEECDSFAASK